MDIKDYDMNETLETSSNAVFFKKEQLKNGPQQFKIVKAVKIPNKFKDNKLENGIIMETLDDYGTQYTLRLNNRNWNELITTFGHKPFNLIGKIVELSVTPGTFQIDGKEVHGYELSVTPMQ